MSTGSLERRFLELLREVRSGDVGPQYGDFLKCGVKELERLLGRGRGEEPGEKQGEEVGGDRGRVDGSKVTSTMASATVAVEAASERRKTIRILAERRASDEARVERPVAVPHSELVILNNRRLESESVVFLPRTVSERLKPYQRDGVRFLWHSLWDDDRLGCILADHMGTGKTATSVVFMSLVLQKKLVPLLVIAPLSVIGTWVDEIKRWCFVENVPTYQLLSDGANSDHEIQTWSNEGGFLLVNYEYFLRMLEASEDIRHALLAPYLVLLDEGHKIKNMDSSTSQKLSLLQTRRRLILTGYPVQNNLAEYWNMVHFACPHLLGSYHMFRKLYEKPIAEGYRSRSTLVVQEVSRRRTWLLFNRLRPVVLRRPVRYLEEALPKKHDSVLFCNLSRCQSAILELLSQNPFLQKNSSLMLTVYILRNLFFHPDALLAYLNSKVSTDKSFHHLKSLADSAAKIVQEHRSTPEEKLGCKFNVVTHIYHECVRRGEKLVVFSQSLSILDTFQAFFLKRFESSLILRFDGSTSMQDRDEIMHSMNDMSHPSKVLLMSLAGSEGVNLTGASRILLVDVNWNPSRAAQAAGRVYRYGQRREVHVYRLVVEDSFESQIFLGGVRKSRLFDTVIDNRPLPVLSHEIDMDKLFSFSDADSTDFDESSMEAVEDDLLNSVRSATEGSVRSIRSYPFSYDIPEFTGVDEILAQKEFDETECVLERESLGGDETDRLDSLFPDLDDLDVDKTLKDYMSVYGCNSADNDPLEDLLQEPDQAVCTVQDRSGFINEQNMELGELEDQSDPTGSANTCETRKNDVVVISSDDEDMKGSHVYSKLPRDIENRQSKLKERDSSRRPPNANNAGVPCVDDRNFDGNDRSANRPRVGDSRHNGHGSPGSHSTDEAVGPQPPADFRGPDKRSRECSGIDEHAQRNKRYRQNADEKLVPPHHLRGARQDESHKPPSALKEETSIKLLPEWHVASLRGLDDAHPSNREPCAPQSRMVEADPTDDWRHTSGFHADSSIRSSMPHGQNQSDRRNLVEVEATGWGPKRKSERDGVSGTDFRRGRALEVYPDAERNIPHYSRNLSTQAPEPTAQVGRGRGISLTRPAWMNWTSSDVRPPSTEAKPPLNPRPLVSPALQAPPISTRSSVYSRLGVRPLPDELPASRPERPRSHPSSSKRPSNRDSTKMAPAGRHRGKGEVRRHRGKGEGGNGSHSTAARERSQPPPPPPDSGRGRGRGRMNTLPAWKVREMQGQ